MLVVRETYAARDTYQEVLVRCARVPGCALFRQEACCLLLATALASAAAPGTAAAVARTVPVRQRAVQMAVAVPVLMNSSVPLHG
jgi:hypothetical protein